MTSPIRKAAAAQGDPGTVNLWAGESYRTATETPADSPGGTPGASDGAAAATARDVLSPA